MIFLKNFPKKMYELKSMKLTDKSANGTSFYNSIIVTSVDTLTKILGEPTIMNNDPELIVKSEDNNIRKNLFLSDIIDATEINGYPLFITTRVPSLTIYYLSIDKKSYYIVWNNNIGIDYVFRPWLKNITKHVKTVSLRF